MSSTDKHKYERRKEQNREAQRKFRLRKALVVTTLEDKVIAFENKTIALEHEVSELQKDNTALRGQVQQLQDTLSGVQRANIQYDVAEATIDIRRSPSPPEAQSNSQHSPLCGSNDMIPEASHPRLASSNSAVLEEPLSLGVIQGNALFNYDDELGHVSPPAPATTPLGASPQDTNETRRLFENSLDGSEISDGERLHTLSSWQTDCTEHSDSRPVTADMQMNQTDSQNTFTLDLSEMPSDSQMHSNEQKGISSLQLSFPMTHQDLNLSHLQQNADVNAEWPQIEPFDTTTTVGLTPEIYGSWHREWSLSALLHLMVCSRDVSLLHSRSFQILR